jgi:RNA polymerase sigma-70 factor (ECF subfamily)
MAISFHTWFSEKKSTEGLLSSNESAISDIFRNEDQNAISTALKLLPAQQRAAFVLSKQEGLSNPEIATVLNTSISAVESLVFRAKQRLVKELLPYYQNKIS